MYALSKKRNRSIEDFYSENSSDSLQKRPPGARSLAYQVGYVASHVSIKPPHQEQAHFHRGAGAALLCSQPSISRQAHQDGSQDSDCRSHRHGTIAESGSTMATLLAE